MQLGYRRIFPLVTAGTIVLVVAALFSGLNAPAVHRRQLQVTQSGDLPNNGAVATTMPQWLSNYVKWHNIVRSDPVIFAQAHVLIVDEGAGGLGDRLKHLPYYLWLASKHSRVLLIHWNTLCGIQEFFQPNLINWTTPPHLLQSAVLLNKRGDKDDYFEHLIDDTELATHQSHLVVQVYGNHLSLVKGLPQVALASENGRRVFKDIFQCLFKLSDPVQQLLDRTKVNIGLGDDYIGVHLRARYPGVDHILDNAGTDIDASGFRDVTTQVKETIYKLGRHAIQCTRAAAGDDHSQVYFASDTVLAMALQQQEDDRVVYLKSDQERVHFAKQASCDQYYPAVVDLWLLSHAKCIGFGAGGFGALATMMSNFDCWTIHQHNSIVMDHVAKATNFFNGDDGNLPKCILPA